MFFRHRRSDFPEIGASRVFEVISPIRYGQAQFQPAQGERDMSTILGIIVFGAMLVGVAFLWRQNS
jgi:hypothetical protein